MSGLQLDKLMVQRTAPAQQEAPPDFHGVLGKYIELGMRGSEADRAAELQQQQLDRQVQRDERAGNREDTAQRLRAREVLMNDKRAGQREDLYAKQEDRREGAARREEVDKTRAEHEQLLRDWQMALQIPDPQARASAVHFAQDALHRAGYQTEEFGQQFGNPPPTPAPAGQAQGGIEDVGDPTGPTPGMTHARPARPMLPGEASSIGRQLDQAGDRYTSALSGKRPVSGKPADKLSAQLDNADAAYSKGLGVAPGLPQRAPLPGQTPFAVVQSNQLLSQDDPYNNIR